MVHMNSDGILKQILENEVRSSFELSFIGLVKSSWWFRLKIADWAQWESSISDTNDWKFLKKIIGKLVANRFQHLWMIFMALKS